MIVAGCLIAIVTFGVRTSFGLFTEPLSELRGWDRETFALAIAMQNLLWGLGQPFAGAVADRYGAGRVLAAGGVVYALGVALMARQHHRRRARAHRRRARRPRPRGRLVHDRDRRVRAARARRQRSWAMGLATAAGSMGQFLFAPLGQGFIAAYGAATALLLLSGFVALVPLLAVSLTGRGEDATSRADESARGRTAARARPPELHAAHRRLLRLRLPHRVHHDPPAAVPDRPRARARASPPGRSA